MKPRPGGRGLFTEKSGKKVLVSGVVWADPFPCREEWIVIQCNLSKNAPVGMKTEKSEDSMFGKRKDTSEQPEVLRADEENKPSDPF